MPSDLPAQASAISYRQVLRGDPFPDLAQACGSSLSFTFKAFAGRYQLYAFFLSAEPAEIRAAIAALVERRDVFDDKRCSFIGVTIDPADRAVRGLRNAEPGVHFAWDFDHRLSQACGATPKESVPGAPTPANRRWVIVDPSMRVLHVIPMHAAGPREILDILGSLPEPNRYGGVVRPAPILMIPNVFETELCERLIELYLRGETEESGIHRGGDGVFDQNFKKRRDYIIADRELISSLCARLNRRVVPEIEKLFFARMSYIERHIVGCYSADEGGHFRPHIDNGGGLTAHRRFAVSVNLSDDFDGGEVVFPEYNGDGYKAPRGWAVIFPCAILHGVRPVTRGARYAYLPFLYDEAGREIRAREIARHADGHGRAPTP